MGIISMDDQPISATFFNEGRWLTEFVTPDAMEIKKLANELCKDAPSKSSCVIACHEWVGSQIKYKPFIKAKLWVEGKSSINPDVWLQPSLTRRIGVGNCLGEGTKLLVINPKGEYEIKKIEDLANYNGYSVISYNHQKGEVEFQPIIGWFNNGIKEVVKVKFNNGERIVATPDHIFFQGSTAKEIELEEAITGNARVLNFRQIPPLSRYQPSTHKYSHEHLWIVGHYLAEGHGDSTYGKTVICNDDPLLRQKLCSCLDKLKVPHGQTDYPHSNYIRILHKKRGTRGNGLANLKESLWSLGAISQDKALTSDFLSLGRPQLTDIMDGYCDGDGYLPSRINRRRVFASRHKGTYHYKNSYVLRYYTASELLADQLKIIHLILGRPLWSWYRANSGGAGRNPLPQYTLVEFKKPSYGQVNSFRDLGELKIRSAEDSIKMPVYDIEVAENHDFMLANGVMVHNCANKAFLLASLLRNEFDPGEVHVVLGNLHNGNPGGHAWVQVRLGDRVYIVESTRPDVEALVPATIAERYEAAHFFNDKTAYAIEGRTVMQPFCRCYSTWLKDYLDFAYIKGRK